MTDLARALDALVPPFDDCDADWLDALRRGGRTRGHRRRLAGVVAAALVLAAFLAVTPIGHALVGGSLDRFGAWIGRSPGRPAPGRDQRLLEEANARAAAPIPAGTELGVLTSKTLDGVSFDLLGFRDRGSLCLRLRSSSGDGTPITKAGADCVSEQLLIDLGKPLAVVAAADPFPRAQGGLQALYGLASDRAATIELVSASGIHRVPVDNNAFLYLYRGEGPRLSHDRLDYRSDVPSRAIALDSSGHKIGSVTIMSLKRGYPGAKPQAALPGPAVLERNVVAPRVGWLEREEQRGGAFHWPGVPGPFAGLRAIRPSPITSMRVLVAKPASGEGYCLTNLWPLDRGPTGIACIPPERFETIDVRIGTAIPFDAQFPIYYGLVADGVTSLRVFLSNGATESVPIVDNVFVAQASAADPAKLVAYDAEGRVVGIRVLSVG